MEITTGPRPSSQELAGILRIILELIPELRLFLRVQALNRGIRAAITLDFYLGLKALYFRNVSNVADDFVLRAFSQRSKESDMSGAALLNFEFSQVSDRHFQTALQSEAFKACLRAVGEINLNACRGISEKTVHEVFAQHCGPSLERIEFYWNCRINDFCVKMLAQSCRNLRHVNFSGCKYLTDAAVTQVAESCKGLYHLNLTRLPQMTGKSLQAIAGAGLADLQYLNLYANAGIEDFGLRALGLARGYAKLRFLDLCGCRHLLDDSVVEMSMSFPDLRYLNLTWCVSLTDKAITEGVGKHLGKLDLLSIFGLVQLTDKSVESLLSGGLKYSLRTLDVNGCRLMTAADHASIVKLFPNVRVTVFHS